MTQKENDWVDFKAVKAAVSLQMVLNRYDINWLRKSGQELRGRCPIHKGEGDRTFHVNVTKGAFNCFSCKHRGNVLDFVAAMEQCSVRDAALKLRDWFGVGETGPVKSSLPATPKVAAALPQAVGDLHNLPTCINPPLAFQLNVNSAHEYGLSRGLNKETLDYFGAGVCQSRGMFAGRFVIPLHDEQGRLVGYAGRSITGSEPKYLLPSREKGFYKSHLLFNLHRVVKEVGADDPVILVEGCFGVMWLRQAGYAALALLGSALSEQQEQLLADHFERLVLLFDGDEAGRAATQDCLIRLARRFFVRVIDLPENLQPDGLALDDLQTLLNLQRFL